MLNENNRGQLVKEGMAASKIIDQFEQCTTAKQPVNKECVTKPNRLSQDRLDMFKNTEGSPRSSRKYRVAPSTGRVRNWEETLEMEKSKKSCNKTATFFSENKELQRATEECATRSRLLSEMREKYQILLDNFNEARTLVGLQVKTRVVDKSSVDDTDNSKLQEEHDQLKSQSVALKDRLSELLNITKECDELRAEVKRLRSEEVDCGASVAKQLDDKDKAIAVLQSTSKVFESHYTSEVKRLNTDIAKLKDAIAKLKEKHSNSDDLENKLRTKEAEVESLTAQIASLELERQREAERLQTERLEMDTKMKEHNREYDELLRRVEQTEREFLHARQQYKAELETRLQKIVKLNEQAKEYCGTISSLETDEACLVEQVTNLEIEKGTLTGVMEQKDRDLANMAAKLATFEFNISKLEPEIQTSREREASTEQSLAVCQHKITELTMEMADKAEFVAELSAVIDSLNVSVKTKDNNISVLQSDISNLSAAEAAHKARIEEVVIERDSEIQRLDELSQCITERASQVPKLSAELEATQQQLDSMSGKLAECRSVAQTVLQERDELKTQIEDTDHGFTACNIRIEELTNELRVKDEMLNQYGVKHSSHANEKGKLESELASLTAKTSDLNIALSYLQVEYENLQQSELAAQQALEEMRNSKMALEKKKEELSNDLAMVTKLVQARVAPEHLDKEFSVLIHEFKVYLEELEAGLTKYKDVVQKYTEMESKYEDVKSIQKSTSSQLEQYMAKEKQMEEVWSLCRRSVRVCAVEVNATRLDKGVVKDVRNGTPDIAVDLTVRGPSVQDMLEYINEKETKIREQQTALQRDGMNVKKREERVIDKENHIKERLAKLREKETKLFDMVRKIKDRNDQIKGLKQNMLDLKEKWADRTDS